VRGESARERRRTYPAVARRSPLLILAHPCSPCLTLTHQAHLPEQREVREYLGELKADFTSLPTANLITSCYPSTQTQRAPDLRLLARQKEHYIPSMVEPKARGGFH
jgi:hypothetical protein